MFFKYLEQVKKHLLSNILLIPPSKGGIPDMTTKVDHRVDHRPSVIGATLSISYRWTGILPVLDPGHTNLIPLQGTFYPEFETEETP